MAADSAAPGERIRILAGQREEEEGFFLGFPSFWNIIAFYLYVLRPPVWVSAALLIVFAVLTFVPTIYIYAARGGPFCAG